jgi:hypothetical protein
MDEQVQQRWHNHCDDQTLQRRQILTTSWTVFKEWTLRLLQNSVTLKPDVMKMMEKQDNEATNLRARLVSI